MAIACIDPTQKIAEDWKANPYYDRAEQEDWMDLFWGQDSHFRRLFEKLDTTVVVDLACGHGRHTARLLSIKTGRHRPKKLYLLDVNQENVEYCKARFAGNPGVQAFRNNGYDFAPLGDSAVSAIVCYDAMVHFEYDAVLSYIRDAFRIWLLAAGPCFTTLISIPRRVVTTNRIHIGGIS